MTVQNLIAAAIRAANHEAYTTQGEEEYNATVANLESLRAEYIDSLKEISNFNAEQFARGCR